MRRAWRHVTPRTSDIQVLDVERVVFDELAARLDLIAHERREHQIGFGVIFGADLQTSGMPAAPTPLRWTS